MGLTLEFEFDLVELDVFELDDEFFDDFLGIVMFWEEKYGKQKKVKKQKKDGMGLDFSLFEG